MRDVHERRETRAVLGGEDDDGRRHGRAAHALERCQISRRGCAPHGPAGGRPHERIAQGSIPRRSVVATR